uniref:PiggyBac transposable element-derived protein domain-containing protein n=1 Tax=Phytophthora ramorum TaxID=164328 RepID=H3H7R6_PHYRM
MAIRRPLESATGSERSAEAEAKEREALASEAKETEMTEEGSVHVEQLAEEKGVEVVVDSPPVADSAEEKEAEAVVGRPSATDATEASNSIGNQRKRRRAIFEDVSASDESSSGEDVAAPELLLMQPQCVVDGDANLMDAAADAYTYLNSDEDLSVEVDQESCDDDGESDGDIGELTDEDSEDDEGEDLPESVCSSIAQSKTAISIMRTDGWEYDPEKFGPDPTYEDLFRARAIRSQQRRAGQELEKLGDIRSRLARVPDIEPWEVLRVMGLLIARMLMPMRKVSKRKRQSRVEDSAGSGCIAEDFRSWISIEIYCGAKTHLQTPLALELLHRRMYLTGTIQTDRAGYAKGVVTKKETKQVNKQKCMVPPQGTIKLAENKRFPQLTAAIVDGPHSSSSTLKWWQPQHGHRHAAGPSRNAVSTSAGVGPGLPGGVDVHDQLRMQRYSVQLSYKTRKYYKTLFLGLFDMALMNAFIVFRHHKKLNDNLPQGKKRPPKHYAFFEALLEQLLAVDSAEAYETIERATTARERTAASPAREAALQDPAPERTAEMGGHRLEENPDTVGNEQGLKKRQRSCTVCALFKTKPRKYRKYFCPECSTENRRKYFCNAARDRDKTCFAIWHSDWNNGNDIPRSLLQKHKLRDRPPAAHPGKKRRRRSASERDETNGDEDSDEAVAGDEA